MAGYSTLRDRTSGDRQGAKMSMYLSYHPRMVIAGEPSCGQTLEDYYRIHNLDEKRRKYLEDLRSQVTGGPLNNLLKAMGLDY